MQALECPVTLTLLDTAVSLFPCSHKVNAVAAERFFGKMNKQRGVEKNAPCPCCRQMIIAYEPDHTVRSWIPLIKKRFPQSVQLEAEQKEKMDPSYPGKSGKFILDKDQDWVHRHYWSPWLTESEIRLKLAKHFQNEYDKDLEAIL